jgi:PAS domain S-box-containing protein
VQPGRHFPPRKGAALLGSGWFEMVDDLSGALAGALERDEIGPFFQPIVDLKTQRVVGFEVLARWRPSVGQIVSPAEFIPVAERDGLIGALTERLLRQACLVAADWPGEVRLSVNISPRQLGDPSMADRLRRVAEEAQFPFRRLTFELTEGAIVEDAQLARKTLERLKSFGAGLALDDFGVGYSGLQHLQMLPFDSLKLDASFVRSMTSHRESRKIVAAVMGLCQTLGLGSVAEGIENQAQLEMLRLLGYSSGQGWLFGRPVPPAEASAALDSAAPSSPTESVARIAEQVALRLEALPIQCLWQLQALYEGAPVGLAFVDANLRYVAVNERLAEMHGLPVAALIGRRVAEIVPGLIDQIEPRFRRALAGETLQDMETRYRLDGPEKLALRTSYQPVRDAAGEVVGVSIAVVDITDDAGPPSRRRLQRRNWRALTKP